MKSIIRQMPIDDVGRIVIPVDIRNGLGIFYKDKLDIHTEGNKIILEKPNTSCCICNKQTNLNKYKDKFYCSSCINKLNSLNIQSTNSSESINKLLKELNEKIIEKRNELEESIEKDKNSNTIFCISVELDELIAKYNQYKLVLEEISIMR